MNKRGLMIIIISALCLISLAGAEEKESGSKIEPKLIYEKRFDFEIEQGKIGDDGSIFPTIFVTKDNRALFTDKKGRTLKILDGNTDIVKVTEDGKNLITAKYTGDEQRKKEVWMITIYGLLGEIIEKKSIAFNQGYLSDIFLDPTTKNVAVFLSGSDFTSPYGIAFYDKHLNLLKLYTAGDFERPIVPGSIWKNLGLEFQLQSKNGQYLIGIGDNDQSCAIYVFDIGKSELLYSRYFDTLLIGSAMISNDGSILACVTCHSLRRIIRDGIKNCGIFLTIIDIPANDWRFVPLSQKFYSTIIPPRPHIVFSSNGKYFAFAYGDTLLIYDCNTYNFTNWGGFGADQIVVLSCSDKGVVVAKNKNEAIMVEKTRTIKWRRQFTKEIIDAHFSTDMRRLNVLLVNGIQIFSF